MGNKLKFLVPLLVLFVFLSGCSGGGQFGNLEVRVVDSSEDKISGATVSVLNFSGSIVASRDTSGTGNVSFQLDAGTYSVTVSKRGYDDYSESRVVVLPNLGTDLRIELVASSDSELIVDLIVADLQVEVHPDDDDLIVYSYNFSVLGDRDTMNQFTVKVTSYYPNGDVYTEINIDYIPSIMSCGNCPRQDGTLTLDPSREGLYTIVVTIDPDDQVEEINEINNETEISFEFPDDFESSGLLKTNLWIDTITVGPTNGIGFVEVTKGSARETYNEGELIEGLAPANPDPEGPANQDYSVKVVYVIQEKANPTEYEAYFELYDYEGNLVAREDVKANQNLAKVFTSVSEHILVFQEGEVFDGLVGSGAFDGLTDLDLKLVQILQSSSTDVYFATFELYAGSSELIDTKSLYIQEGSDLRTVFNDGEGEYALGTEVTIDKIYVTSTQGYGYVDLIVGENNPLRGDIDNPVFSSITKGEIIPDLDGAGIYLGEVLTVNFVEIPEYETGSYEKYTGVFELHRANGTLIDSRNINEGENLADVFLDENQDNALATSVIVPTIAVGGTSGISYAELVIKDSTIPIEVAFSCSQGQKVGDVNDDGEITSLDTDLLGQVVSGLALSPENICCADATRNGSLNIDDVLYVGQIAEGLVDVLGNNSARLTLDSGVYNVLTQSVDVSPGETYELKGLLKTNLSQTSLSNGSCQFDVYGGSGSFDEAGTILIGGETDWAAYSFEFTVPSDLNTIQVRLLQTEIGSTGICWFDDISLVKLTPSEININLLVNHDFEQSATSLTSWSAFGGSAGVIEIDAQNSFAVADVCR